MNWFWELFLGEGMTPQKFVGNAVRSGLDEEFKITDRLALAKGWVEEMSKMVLNWVLDFVLDFFPSEQDKHVDATLSALGAEKASAAGDPEHLAALKEAESAVKGAGNGGVDRLMARFSGDANKSAADAAKAVYNMEFKRKATSLMNKVFDDADVTVAGGTSNMDAPTVASMRAKFPSIIDDNGNWKEFAEAYPELFALARESAEYYSGVTRGADGIFNEGVGGVYVATKGGTLAFDSNTRPGNTFNTAATLAVFERQVVAERNIAAGADIFNGSLNEKERGSLAAASAAQTGFMTSTLANGAIDTGISQAEFEKLAGLSAADKATIARVINNNIGSGDAKLTLTDIDIDASSGLVDMTFNDSANKTQTATARITP